MNNRIKKTLTAATLGLGLVLAAPAAHAQMPAFLPLKDTVAQGAATDADGTYVVSTINKRITIENGRAYVVDPWTHAFILSVEPNMVTLQNFRQTGPETFEADDLPMMGKVVFTRLADGTLDGVVAGPLGEAQYQLIPTELATAPIGDGPIADTPIDDVPPIEVVEEPIEEWLVYVRQIQCERRALDTTISNGVTGQMTISASIPSTALIPMPVFRRTTTTAPEMTLSVDCKRNDTIRETYSYDRTEGEDGLLVLRGTRAEIAAHRLNFAFDWKYTPGIKQRSDRNALSNTPMHGAGLPIGESHTTTWTVGPRGMPELKLLLRVKRVEPTS